MNIPKFIFLFALMSAFAFVSCEDESVDGALLIDNPPGPILNAGIFTASIDGSSFSAGSKSATYTAEPGIGYILTITGIKPSGEYISIQMANPSVGTFIADNNTAPETNVILSYRPSLGSSDIFSAFNPITNEPTGILKITSFDVITKKVSGSFNFSGYPIDAATPVHQITNGVFTDISFVIQ